MGAAWAALANRASGRGHGFGLGGIADSRIGTALVGDADLAIPTGAFWARQGQCHLDGVVVDLHAAEELVLLDLAGGIGGLAQGYRCAVGKLELDLFPVQVIPLGDVPACQQIAGGIEFRIELEGLIRVEEFLVLAQAKAATQLAQGRQGSPHGAGLAGGRTLDVRTLGLGRVAHTDVGAALGAGRQHQLTDIAADRDIHAQLMAVGLHLTEELILLDLAGRQHGLAQADAGGVGGELDAAAIEVIALGDGPVGGNGLRILGLGPEGEGLLRRQQFFLHTELGPGPGCPECHYQTHQCPFIHKSEPAFSCIQLR